MVNKILQSAGLISGIDYNEVRFVKPPKTAYAVYLDSYTRKGADNKASTKHHSVTIELYEYKPEVELELRIEKALDDYYSFMSDGWIKQNRYWINSEQMYQVIYEFDYIEKQRGGS
jgi:hypothetical protein